MKIVLAFALCVILFSTFAGGRGATILTARREAIRMAADISTLRAENARLKRLADALQSDPEMIEKIARETLGLARPDEILVTRARR
jgi:cell division protein FtsB